MQNVTSKEVGGNIIERKMDTHFPFVMMKTIGMTEILLRMIKQMNVTYQKKNTKNYFLK